MFLTVFNSKKLQSTQSKVELEIDRFCLENALSNYIFDLKSSYITSRQKSFFKIYYQKRNSIPPFYRNVDYDFWIDNYESQNISDRLSKYFSRPYLQFLLLTDKPVEQYHDFILIQSNEDYGGHESFEVDILNGSRIILQDNRGFVPPINSDEFLIGRRIDGQLLYGYIENKIRYYFCLNKLVAIAFPVAQGINDNEHTRYVCLEGTFPEGEQITVVQDIDALLRVAAA